MAPRRSAKDSATMPVSPRSNSPHSDTAAIKVDSPSEKQINALVAADDNAIMDDDEADFDMADEDAIEDDGDEQRPYKRVCRGRESALSMAMNDLSKKSIFARPIIVRVGSVTNGQDFHIHPARLAASSEYFSDLLEKQEDPTSPLELPEDDPVVFQLYAHYIYDKSSISTLDLSSPTSDSRTAAYDTYVDLLQAYIFGEKIQDSEFQNEVMNRILQCMGNMHNSNKPTKTTGASKELPSASSSENIVRPLIELLYPSLPPDSIGRGLVVETFIVLWSHSDNLQNFVPDLSRELLTEIAEMLLSGDKDHIRDAWAQAINGDYSYYHSARYDEH